MAEGETRAPTLVGVGPIRVVELELELEVGFDVEAEADVGMEGEAELGAEAEADTETPDAARWLVLEDDCDWDI